MWQPHRSALDNIALIYFVAANFSMLSQNSYRGANEEEPALMTAKDLLQSQCELLLYTSWAGVYILLTWNLAATKPD